MNEEEKRLHRCCFSGHRPEKLEEPEAEVKKWLAERIEEAIRAGYTTFISGCAMGVDIWAAQIVLERKEREPSLHLIAATPWPGFANRWNDEWREQYSDLLKRADLVVNVSDHFHDCVFQQRNEWMVNHCNRIIAYFNGAPGGTRSTLDYAAERGLEVVRNDPESEAEENMERIMHASSGKRPYPENLITDLGLEAVFGKNEFSPLNDDQIVGLQKAIESIRPREQEALRLRYEEQKTLQAVGEHFSLSRERARQILVKALRKLRNPMRLEYIREGYEAAELRKKLKCAGDLKKSLAAHLKKHPLATEEDIVKFVFQGMLGVGHLIRSHEQTLQYIVQEMNGIEADDSEPLTEKLSTYWLRLNLRAARAREIDPETIASVTYDSAQQHPVSFTRENVYRFCMKLEGIDRERMQAAAEKVLDESWLPSHSEAYRKAYHPAYRVVYRDYRKRISRQKAPEETDGKEREE